MPRSIELALAAALHVSIITSVSGFASNIGGKRDKHGCQTGTGYSWCPSTQECIRSWRTPCPASAPAYKKVTTQFQRCHPIRTIKECEKAAKVLHMRDTSAADDQQSAKGGVAFDPPFCYYEAGHLKFNSRGNNRGRCSRYDWCLCGRKGSHDGNWKLLFRQTAPKYMSKRSWLSVNAGQPRNPNYSILGKLDNADRGADGDFTFKIIWPRHAGRGPHYNVWKQTSNPVLDSKIIGYKPVEIHFKQNHWGGLEHSGSALLDGSVSNGNWWYAIGSQAAYSGGIPGPSTVEPVVELYVQQGAKRKACANGAVGVTESRVAAGIPMTPEVYFNGGWFPVCGHYFWDSNLGAASICRQLGFGTGLVKATREQLELDAMPVGLCGPGQRAPIQCTAGGNAWGKFDYRGGSCKAGKNVGVQIVCSGGASSAYHARDCVNEGGLTKAPTNKHGGAVVKSGGVRATLRTVKVDGIAGHTTYQLVVDTSGCPKCANVYAMAGNMNSGEVMMFPPAWNIESSGVHMASLGSSFGPPDASLFHVQPKLRYDSWLSIGMHPSKNKLESVGLQDAKNWRENSGLDIEDGALFFTNPRYGPRTKQTVIAQLTLRTGHAFDAAALFRGRETNGNTWSSYLTWSHKPAGSVTGIKTMIQQMNTPGQCKDKCSPTGGYKGPGDPKGCTASYCDAYKPGGRLRARCAKGNVYHSYALAECEETCGLCGRTGIAGHSTFRLMIDTSRCAKCHNVYAMAGNKANFGDMHFPPAWQYTQKKGFGSTVGPPNPAFLRIAPTLRWDSWLAVGDSQAKLSVAGMDDKLGSWNTSQGIDVSNGMIFFGDPFTGPTTSHTVIAQLTVPAGKPFMASALFAGRTKHGSRPGAGTVNLVWEQYLTWNYQPDSGAASGH